MNGYAAWLGYGVNIDLLFQHGYLWQNVVPI